MRQERDDILMTMRTTEGVVPHIVLGIDSESRPLAGKPRASPWQESEFES
jgi:hypothetical protein